MVLHKESVTIRWVDNDEIVFFNSRSTLIGITRIFPCLSESATDGRHQK